MLPKSTSVPKWQAQFDVLVRTQISKDLCKPVFSEAFLFITRFMLIPNFDQYSLFVSEFIFMEYLCTNIPRVVIMCITLYAVV